jgi:hypothetical protein
MDGRAGAATLFVLLATGCASAQAHGISTTGGQLNAGDVASAPVTAILAPHAEVQAAAAARACQGSGGFNLKMGSFALDEEILVTHSMPYRLAAARAIGACLRRQLGVIQVIGLAVTRPTPSATVTP